MSKEKESVIRKTMILFDGFVVSFAFFLAYFLGQHFNKYAKLDLMPSTQVIPSTFSSMSEYLVALFFVVPLWCLMLYLNGMYLPLRIRKLREIVRIIIKSSFFSILALAAVVFLFKLHFVSRMFFAIFFMASVTSMLLEKITIFSILHYVRKQGHNYKRLLIVGNGRRAAAFINKIQSHPEWGFKILGTIDDEPSRGIKKAKDVKVIGTLKDLPEMLHRHAIDEVIFVVPRLRLHHIENAVCACETEGVKATIAMDLFDLKIARSYQTDIDGIPFLTFKTTNSKEFQLFIKRAMDIVLSGLGIILLSPLLLIVSILIKLTSSGPVLFKQRRIGLNGREFVFIKFRSMYDGTDRKLSELVALNEMEGPIFKIKKDPRVTPVGRILRKFSIDELPQFFNVFVGHMSLIGPRPPLPKEVEQYKSWQRRRLSMRPGLSCLWQIRGRNNIDFDEWMKLDLEYLDNWSLWLDFKILIKTIPVVLFGIGAY
jgi:exopolysaccharide biosynthesis polyprenyl glycosylphosphotransferase